MKKRILILGAGFGGLELASRLSEEMSDDIEATLIDRNDSFVFGFSKLDVMFGRRTPESIRVPYSSIAKPGVRVLQQTATAIDPVAKRVTTDQDEFEADHMVIALGADYDLDATPGLGEAGYEFYSVPGAERVSEVLPDFEGGRVIIGVCDAPFKCPPAPSECALMMHDYLTRRGLREKSEIKLVMPFPSPVPPSPDTSAALLEGFAERGIEFVPGRKIMRLEPGMAILSDDSEMPFDLFLGVPRHCVPKVVEESGLSATGWIDVNPRTLETTHPGVYAVGDVSNTGVPKAGAFAEGAAKSVATALIAEIKGEGEQELYPGAGVCYIEFGAKAIGKVDVNFLSGPKPTGHFHSASVEMRVEKERFGSTRRERWFGLA
jgi:sulfide:quinone oxidoreductase